MGDTVLEIIEDLKAQIAALQNRVVELEHGAQTAATPAAPVAPDLDEQTVILIASAVAAYLGKRPRIRAIRLLGTTNWAQEGRVSIQASHRLQR
jgi:methylmalonyl-CoA carboxyltransferase large subunit